MPALTLILLDNALPCQIMAWLFGCLRLKKRQLLDFNVWSIQPNTTASWSSSFELTIKRIIAVFVFPDYDLSKLKDFMDQQVDSYIEKGIIAKDEGDTIKRIYSSL